VLAKPHAMVGVNVVCADDEARAQHLATSLYLRFLGMQRGKRGPLPRPVASMEGLWSDAERAGVQRMLAVSAIGAPDTVRDMLAQIIDATQADELIVATALHDHAARLRSYELLAALAQA
jgi:alkanesulfonate monooxygenase SsuD/methylene tetrahydromethanopterin reductase-like flavin-dependent oxidoreductase (luciferase family)